MATDCSVVLPDASGLGLAEIAANENTPVLLITGHPKGTAPEKAKHGGPRQGSLGRRGGGRPLALFPDETVGHQPWPGSPAAVADCLERRTYEPAKRL